MLPYFKAHREDSGGTSRSEMMSAPIKPARLGRTTITLSRLGFGCTALGNIMRATPASVAADALDAAWQSGIRSYDTAPQYGQGLAEERLGAFLADKPRHEFVLSTKIGKRLEAIAGGRAPGGLFVDANANAIVFDYSYDGAMRSLEESLARMKVSRVDILLIHDVNRRYHGEAVHDVYATTMNGAYKALLRLRDEGVIGAFGPALNDVDILLRFVNEGDFDCLMLPRGYSLLHHEAAGELLPLCHARGIGVLIASPFESGILATGPVDGATYLYAPASDEVRERVARIESICRDHDTPLAAAALQYPARHPAVTSVVVGMRTAREVRENCALMERPIPPELWNSLAAAGLIPHGAP